MRSVSRIESRALLLAHDDIDTDQIIPARFLTTTGRDGLGAHCFAGWRYHADGSVRGGCPLTAPGAKTRRILIGGRNFGCGSSREHAAWALLDFGFQAVVASSFADIFRGNALKNGLVPVQLDMDEHATLVRLLAERAELPLVVDVEAQQLRAGAFSWHFPLAPFARRCLLEGVDQLGYLLAAKPQIAAFESLHRDGPVTTSA